MRIRTHTLFVYTAALSFVLSSSAYIKGLSDAVGLFIDAVQAIILVHCVVHIYKKKSGVDIFTLLVFGLYAVLGISTALGTKEYLSYLVYAVQGIGAVVFIRYELERDPKDAIRALRNTIFIALCANLIQVIFFPITGVAKDEAYYLLGLRVAFTPFVVTGCFFSVLYDTLYRVKLSLLTGGMIVVGLATLIMENVSTGIVTLVVVAIMYLLMNAGKLRISLYPILIIYAVLFVAIVVFEAQYNIPGMAYLLNNLLGRDLTFDNRTTIWSAALAQIIQKPLMGYGLSGGGNVYVEFSYRIATLSAHDQFLETLHQGGMIAFVILCAMFVRVAGVTKKYRGTKEGNLCICFTMAFLIIMFAEVQMTKALVFLVLATAANLSMFSKVVVASGLYEGSGNFKNTERNK